MAVTINISGNVNSLVVNSGEGTSINVDGEPVWESGPKPSEFDFVIPSGNRELWLAITESTAGCVTVDWGDGSTRSGVDQGWADHVYNAAGLYTVRVYCDEAETWVPGNTDGGSVFDPDSTTRLVSIRAGDGMVWFDSTLIPAFAGQTALTSVEMQADYNGEISSESFAGCTALEHVRLSGAAQLIGTGNAFADCPLLTSFGADEHGNDVRITAGTTLYPWCRGATRFTSIVIPDGFTTIYPNALTGCTGITTLTIPASVTTIQRNAFNGCTNLASVYCLATTPPTVANANAFTGIGSTVPIYVPAASVSAYKAAGVWSTRADYIQAIPA